MCKVYEFSTKVKLTEEMENRLYEAGKNYAKALYDVLEELYPYGTDETEYNELMELLVSIYMKGIDDVVMETEG